MLQSLAQRVSPYYDDDPLSLVGILDEYGLDTALLCTKAAVWNPKEARLFAVACARELRSEKHPWFDKTLNLMNRYARGDLHASEARSAHGRAWAVAKQCEHHWANYDIASAAVCVTLPDAGEAALVTARLLQSSMINDAKDERQQQQEMTDAANELIESHFRKFFGYLQIK
jgi:hypothetical protein